METKKPRARRGRKGGIVMRNLGSTLRRWYNGEAGELRQRIMEWVVAYAILLVWAAVTMVVSRLMLAIFKLHPCL